MWLAGTPALAIDEWVDPVVATAGLAVDGRYVETLWLALLGPSATWAWRRLARAATRDLEQPSVIVLLDLADELGLGHGQGVSSPLVRTIERLMSFGMARRSGPAALDVRTWAPPLPARNAERLPPRLYELWWAWDTSATRPAA